MPTREFRPAVPAPPPTARGSALGAVLALAGAALLVGSVLSSSDLRPLGLIGGALLVVVGVTSLTGNLREARRRRTQPPPAPVLVLDQQGFTAWGDLRVRWADVVSWEVRRHHGLYRLEAHEIDPDDDPDDTEVLVDELLVFVTVADPEAYLARLAPDVRELYADFEMHDERGRPVAVPSPIRFGVDGLDAPPAEVVAEIERFSRTAPSSRPATP